MSKFIPQATTTVPNGQTPPSNPAPTAVAPSTSTTEAEEASVEAYVASVGKTEQFQSDQAREIARKMAQPEPTGKLVSGRIETVSEPAASAEEARMYEKMVKVRPRQTHARIRYGNYWYRLVKGQDVVVPRHFARILEEKGIL